MDYELIPFAQATGAPVPLLLATDPGAPMRLHDFLVRQLAVGPNQAASDFLAGRAHITGYASSADYYAAAAQTPAPFNPAGPDGLLGSGWVLPVAVLGVGLLAWRLS